MENLEFRKRGHNYVVKDEYGNISFVKRRETNRKLEQLIRVLSALEKEALFEGDYSDSTSLLSRYVDLPDKYRLKEELDRLTELKDELTNCPASDPSDVTWYEDPSLESLGYKVDSSSPGTIIYQKVIRDDDEAEVVEEIIIPQKIRRIRTILWEKTDFGRHSKSIKYRKIRMSKRIAKAIDNLPF